MSRRGANRHVDYDTPNDHVASKHDDRINTTEQLIRALITKDRPIEVARVPTHILDSMLHAEPTDNVIKAGSFDVTRVNLTQLRTLVRILETRTEKISLSRWRIAAMAPVGSVDLPEFIPPPPPTYPFPQETMDKIPRPPSPPIMNPSEEQSIEMAETESGNAHDEPLEDQEQTFMKMLNRIKDAENKKVPSRSQITRRSKKRKRAKALELAVVAAVETVAAAPPTSPPAAPKRSMSVASPTNRRPLIEWDRNLWNPPPPPLLSSDRSSPIDYRTTNGPPRSLTNCHFASAGPPSHLQPMHYNTRPRHDSHSRQSEFYNDSSYYGFH